MAIEVTLAIDSTVLIGELATTTVADRLVQLGGPIVAWTPDMSGAPARAIFRFKNPARCDQFVADALASEGVAIATLQVGTQELGRELQNAQTAHKLASAAMVARATNQTRPTVGEVLAEYLARRKLLAARQALYPDHESHSDR